MPCHDRNATLLADAVDHPGEALTQIERGWGQGPSARYENLAARFRPIFTRIGQEAVIRDAGRRLPYAELGWLKEAGFTKLRLAAEFGGAGVSLPELLGLLIELSAADPNLTNILRPHLGFTEDLLSSGNALYARHWLAVIGSGDTFGNGFSELAGNVGVTSARLTREGDGWRLNGRKFYTTGTLFADWINIGAVDDNGAAKGAIVPRDAPGVDVSDDWNGFGQTLTASGTTIFDNVEVLPEEVGARGGNNPFLRRHGATRAQLHLVAVMGGIIRNVLGDAIDFTANKARAAKHSSAEKASGDPFVQQTVGDISALSHVIDVTIADVGRHLDRTADAFARGESDPAILDDLVLSAQLANSKAQIVVGRLAQQAAERLFDTGGGSAIARKQAFDRHWRNVRTLLNHNPSLLRGRVLGDYYLNGARDDFDEGRVF